MEEFFMVVIYLYGDTCYCYFLSNNMNSKKFATFSRQLSGTKIFYNGSKIRLMSSSKNTNYKLVVIGGGCGGCSSAAKFARKLGSGNVAVVEPSSVHYYQPMWTMVGGGMKTLDESRKPMKSVIPKAAHWYQNRAIEFEPQKNEVTLCDGSKITYDFLIISMGMQLNYSQIKGLPAAFNTAGVCSNYSADYVNKTLQSLHDFKSGNAIFNFPNTPIKCAGAPQKIMYIADEYFRKSGKREKANIMFCSAGSALFAVKKYADALHKVVEKRGIELKLGMNLIEVKSESKEAIFKKISSDETVSIPYEMIHVTPPMSAPDVLRNNQDLVDNSGFLDVHKYTLQHNKYGNIFGIGDCTNLPTSRTMAAVAAELGVLSKNLSLVMAGREPTFRYDGYASCPLVTGYSKCILAEFDYDGQPMETFPINQAKERRSMFHMKKDLMPQLYWNAMLKGVWSGPATLRKIMHFGLSR